MRSRRGVSHVSFRYLTRALTRRHVQHRPPMVASRCPESPFTMSGMRIVKPHSRRPLTRVFGTYRFSVSAVRSASNSCQFGAMPVELQLRFQLSTSQQCSCFGGECDAREIIGGLVRRWIDRMRMAVDILQQLSGGFRGAVTPGARPVVGRNRRNWRSPEPLRLRQRTRQ